MVMIDLNNKNLLRYLPDFLINELKGYWYQKVPDHKEEIDTHISDLLNKYENYKTLDNTFFKTRVFTILFSYYSQFVLHEWGKIQYFSDKIVIGYDEGAPLEHIALYTKTFDPTYDNWFEISNNELIPSTAYNEVVNTIANTTVQQEFESLVNTVIPILTDLGIYRINKPTILPPRRIAPRFDKWLPLDILVKDFNLQIPGYNV